MLQEYFHQPVLLQESVDSLVTDERGVYVDCNVGGAGHSLEILRRIGPAGKLLCLDADPDAIRSARKKLELYPNVIIRQVFFDQLEVVLVEEDLLPVKGILFDLGISSFQVDESSKGFSFQGEGPLDMRFRPSQKKSAETVVNEYSAEALAKIFWDYGEERMSGRIASEIVRARKSKPIRTTSQLADIVSGVIKYEFRKKSLARIFQSIRIEVNDELNRLRRALEQAFHVLDKNGTLVTLDYHSLEDKIIKDFFKYKELDCICPPQFPKCVCNKVSEMKVLTRKPVRPDSRELKHNLRARSAKMRVARKIVPYQG